MFVHEAHSPVRSLFMWQREGQLRHVAGQMAHVYGPCEAVLEFKVNPPV